MRKENKEILRVIKSLIRREASCVRHFNKIGELISWSYCRGRRDSYVELYKVLKNY